jgi:hypothetical protein
MLSINRIGREKDVKIVSLLKKVAKNIKACFNFFISIFLNLLVDGHHFGSTIFCEILCTVAKKLKKFPQNSIIKKNKIS